MVKMERVYLFSTIGQAIAYYRYKEPARQKFTNIYEPDRPSKPHFDDFDPKNPHRVWCAISYAIAWVSKRKSDAEYWAFCYWHIIAPDTRMSIDDIAAHMRLPVKTIRRLVKRYELDIGKILVDRELLDPNFEDNQAYARCKTVC